MKRYISVAAMAAVAMVSAGCFEFSRNASSITGPSAGANFSVSALAGTYSERPFYILNKALVLET